MTYNLLIADIICINCGNFTGYSKTMGCCAIYPLCHMGNGKLSCEGMPTGCDCICRMRMGK